MTDRQTDIETYGQIDRDVRTDRHRDISTDRRIETYRQTDTDVRTDRH